jgi:hypothetical protein
MRELADSTRIEQFMRALGQAARVEGRAYLTGGATAVLHGWRATTIDIDIKLIPDRDELLREIPRLKEELDLNVELAAPSEAERGHEQDLLDVKEMIASKLVDPADAISQFESIESELYRFPAIDPASFRRSVEELFK